MFNDVTAKILTVMFTVTLQRFPGIDGFIVRTGETYVYDTPYHKGNSPVKGVKSYVDQQQIWIPFIKYLRDTVCEEMKTVLLFRGWLNFGEFLKLVLNESVGMRLSSETPYSPLLIA